MEQIKLLKSQQESGKNLSPQKIERDFKDAEHFIPDDQRLSEIVDLDDESTKN